MDKPAEELVKSLEVLRLRLTNSGIPRTFGLLESLGNDCSYYRKSLDIFLKRDFDELYSLICAAKAEMEGLK